jgi:hypothetical protein
VLVAADGLCARFATSAPFEPEIQTIPISEPLGFLRSWDVRADWRADAPACTAVLDRPYESASAFPAWFLNMLDFARPGRRDLTLAISGFVTTGEPGTLAVDLGDDMRVTGRVGAAEVSTSDGRTLRIPLGAGSHPLDLHVAFSGERWKFVPTWNGRSAWSDRLLTITAPGAGSSQAKSALRLLTTTVVVLLVVGWAFAATAASGAGAVAIAWTSIATLVLVAMAATGVGERLSGALLLGAAALPLARRQRSLRFAFFVIGVPWMAFFVGWSLGQIGHVKAYSADDWLSYQVAGYRIFMNGFWLEGGSRTFDYQPLYRWISGALHLVFGDSSVGEVYLDAAALLSGALLACELVRRRAGVRGGLVAAGATLATFTLGTIWYFVGRGLSEVAAGGALFIAAFFMLRARLGGSRPACLAGLAAVVMFYTRLNHLVFAAFLAALLLPASATTAFGDVLRARRRIAPMAAALYAAVFAGGLLAFCARTWWYTGVFSLFYGTSLKNNDTGLRVTTLMSPLVWRKIAHSLAALAFMNEPPRPDPRAIFVAAGLVLAALAIVQIPRVVRLPAALVLTVAGGAASAFFVHTHNYPGRMSIQVVPFAVALTMTMPALLRR